MRLELYAFEYFDEIKKRWVRARYRATRGEIAARYHQFRTVGEPEHREVEEDPAKRFPTAPTGRE